MSSRVANDETADNDMIQKLMHKVAEQARELSSLYSELSESKQIIDSYEKQPRPLGSGPHENHYLTNSSTMSKDAQKKRIEKEHKEQLSALERQLAITQHRYDEIVKHKNHLVIENEKLTREIKFHEKCTNDLQQDVQKLRSQLESTNRRLGLDSSARGGGSSINLFEEMKLMKTHYKQIEIENQNLKNESYELKLKIKVLEDALEFRAEEIGLSGHADLLTKLSYLKGEISAMKKDLLKKNSLVENLENEKSSIRSEAETLQQRLTQVQQNLMETKHDLNRSKQLLNIPTTLHVSSAAHSNSSPTDPATGRSGGQGEAYEGQSTASAPAYVVNALDQIKSLEQERDLLIEFIQTDLQKSSQLQTELNDLKFHGKSTSEEKERLERQLVTVTEKLKSKSMKCEELSKEVMKMESEFRTLEHERNEYRVMAQKREEEIQELYDTNSHLSSQVSEYESKSEKLDRQLHHIKAENQNQSLTVGILSKDSELWKGRYEETERAHYDVLTELQELKPKLSGLESEYKRLHREHDQLLQEREEHLNQLAGYSEYRQLKEELSGELEAMREFIQKTEFPIEMRPTSSSTPSSVASSGRHRQTPLTPSRSTPGKKRSQPLASASAAASSGGDGGGGGGGGGILIRNLVEKHGLWCGIPCLRSFHPTLGEYIRVLYQDLHDTHATLQRIEESHERLREAHEEVTEKLQKVRKENEKKTEECLEGEEEKRKREKQEREWSRVVEEMRTVMSSAMQLMEKKNQQTLQLSLSLRSNGKGVDKTKSKRRSPQRNHKRSEREFDDEPEPYEPIDSEGSEEEGQGESSGYRKDQSRGQGRGVGRGIDRDKGKRNRDLHHLRDDEIQLEDLLEDFSPHASHVIPSSSGDTEEDTLFHGISSSPSPSPSEDTESAVELIHTIPLSQLPSLLSQLLIHNITLANSHPTLQQQLTQLQQSNSILLHKHSSADAQNHDLQSSIRHTQQQVAHLHESKRSTEEELRSQAEEATELVEKQNALIVTLEAKLTELRRKMLLKGSQVTSLQQRELAMQKKLYQTLLFAFDNLQPTITFSLSLPHLPLSTFSASGSTHFGATISSHNTATTAELGMGTVTLPELLNLTRSCFEDLVKWEQNLNLNPKHSSGPGPGSASFRTSCSFSGGGGGMRRIPQQRHHEEDSRDREEEEEENLHGGENLDQQGRHRGEGGGSGSGGNLGFGKTAAREPFLRRRPPTIPRR